jgi:hypothetical protein
MTIWGHPLFWPRGFLERYCPRYPKRGNRRELRPQKPRSLTPAEVEKEIGSRRSRASEAPEASGSKSSAEIQSEGAN